MSELSLEYYVSMCKGNAELFNTFKVLLLEDFRSIERNFFYAAEAGDVPTMRSELHKMYPLAGNLKFSSLLQVIEKYRSSDLVEFPMLHSELKECLTRIYDVLKPE